MKEALRFFVGPLVLFAMFTPSDSVSPAGAVRDGLPGDPSPEHERRAPARIPPRVLVGLGLLLGLAMIGASCAWFLVLRGGRVEEWFPRRGWAGDLVVGSIAGAVFAVLAYRLLDHVPALRRIEYLLFTTLDMPALRFHHAIVFGMLAGIPEEILFRGAMQPALGVVLAGVIFGALHAITLAYFVYATAAGIALGLLAIWRDGLWAPIAAHTVIDAIMFVLLIRKWRRLTAYRDPSFETPRSPDDRS